MSINFHGHDKLVASLDAAVALGDDHAITDALRKTLCRMIRDEEVALLLRVTQQIQVPDVEKIECTRGIANSYRHAPPSS